jgi:DNA repair exonuclease SbcCD ATPase subunit
LSLSSIEDYSGYLTTGKLDSNSAAAPSDASQSVVELKDQRHKRREDLRVLRRQLTDQQELLANIEHRLHSARDVLRLKKEGIGRIEIVECPTCHRSLDASTFQLTSQSIESVEAHIAALERDRTLVRDNIVSSDDQIIRLSADLANVENRLREAERALGTVNQAIGASREQLAKAASDLASTETEIERIAEASQELLGLQIQIRDWIKKAGAAESFEADNADLDRRLKKFISQLRELLMALGHGGVLSQLDSELHLDEHYIPYLGPRRLRSLGSASDHSRLIAAYVLALAVASEAEAGLHPGFVVLDEPLQQNPDKAHRDLFINFLTSETAHALKAQTLVFTWLHEPELDQLRAKGVNVITPEGDHFLHLVTAPANSQTLP